ncbi:MAG: hypothetical protein WCA98_01620 [Candidatus Acidiferrales bacterium]
MKRALVGLGVTTLLAFLIVAVPASAQTQAPVKRVVAPRYAASQETTLSGVVQSVVTKPATGMLAGDHLLVATPKGTVDAELGGSYSVGRHAVTFTPGESVKVVGVKTAIKGSSVFLVRTVQSSSHLYTFRTPTGAPLAHGSDPAADYSKLQSTGMRSNGGSR